MSKSSTVTQAANALDHLRGALDCIDKLHRRSVVRSDLGPSGFYSANLRTAYLWAHCHHERRIDRLMDFLIEKHKAGLFRAAELWPHPDPEVAAADLSALASFLEKVDYPNRMQIIRSWLNRAQGVMPGAGLPQMSAPVQDGPVWKMVSKKALRDHLDVAQTRTALKMLGEMEPVVSHRPTPNHHKIEIDVNTTRGNLRDWLTSEDSRR